MSVYEPSGLAQIPDDSQRESLHSEQANRQKILKVTSVGAHDSEFEQLRPTEARHSITCPFKVLNSVGSIKSVGPMNADLADIEGQLEVNLTVRQEEPNYDQPITDIICTGVDRR